MQGSFREEQSDEALLALLGDRLAQERLRRNWSQAELAREAGVSRATVQRLEAGASTQLTNLLRILRALDLVRGLDALVPAASVRPLERLEHGREGRRRASPRTRDESEPEGPWTWGDA